MTVLLNVYLFEVGVRHSGKNGTERDKLTGEKTFKLIERDNNISSVWRALGVFTK